MNILSDIYYYVIITKSNLFHESLLRAKLKGTSMKLKLLEKRQETGDTFSFIFLPEESVSWKAGQFIFYTIPHEDKDERGDTRHFTITTPPHEKKIKLTTRYSFQKSSSFKKALFAKEPGDIVEAKNVRGKFTIENTNQKFVFIAGGIGITPFYSILLDLEKQHKIKDIILIYSNKKKENIVFKEELERLKKKYAGLKIIYIFSPQHCDKELLEDSVTDIQNRFFYLSGPFRMVKSVEEALKKLWVDQSKIKKDYIPGYHEES